MSRPNNLSEVSAAELEEFLDSFDTVLCDCDGVLFLLASVIEGTPEALSKLTTLGKQIHYVTNNCSRSRKNFNVFLQQLGFTSTEENIITPAVAIIDYLKTINFNKKLFVMSFNGLKTDLVNAGFEVVENEILVVQEDPKSAMAALYGNNPDIGAIIVDMDLNVNYAKLQQAVFYLRDPQVHFIAAAQDPLITVGKNIHLIGPQHFQNIIKTVSGRDPMGFGKPSKALGDFVNKKFNLNPSRTLFIGDTFSDMIFANDAGYQKLLVFSGIVNEDDMKSCTDPKLLPKYYLNSLSDLNDLLDRRSAKTHSSL